MKLSAIILSRNSQAHIRKCIASVSWADEVLLIDSHSTDKTAQIAKEMGATVLAHTTNNFAKQRTYAINKAKHEWIFYIDVDERVTDDLRSQIETVVSDSQETNERKFVAYTVERKNYYLGDHEWPKTERLERLFLKSNLNKWRGALHETAEFDGLCGSLSGYLLHYTHTDLTSMLLKTNEWADIESDLIIASNHPPIVWWRFLRIMVTKFFDSYIKQGGWRVGTAGLIESIFQAYSYFVIYAKAWEKQQHEEN